MMKYLLTILLLFISIGVFAQRPGENNLGEAAKIFHKALIDKDSVKLKSLLLDGLTYGHSNGWIQSKSEVIGDLYNGKLTYQEINTGAEMLKLEGETGIVRTEMQIKVVMEGKPLELKLKVLEVWQWKNKHWELLARQSVKI